MRWRWIRRGTGLAVLTVLGALAYGAATYSRIRGAAGIDEAAPADVIIVLGAAQYNGRPSPVLEARLDHALDLFNRGLANVVITTGGYGPDPNYSEAHVSASYLNEMGIDTSQIVTQQGSGSTTATVVDAARHMNANGWTRAIVVSDGFHLYRLKEIFRDKGIEVFGSPAPGSRIEQSEGSRFWFSVREVVVLSAYRAGRLFG